MRFELIGLTKAKFTKVLPFCIKLGQKDTRPAAQLRIMATVSNSILDKFSPSMREFLFEKAKDGGKVQKQLEGVEVVSELPTVRERGQVAQAMNAVQQFKPEHGEYRGAIRCTKCGSSLNFCVASNGLSRGQCAAACGVRWCT